MFKPRPRDRYGKPPAAKAHACRLVGVARSKRPMSLCMHEVLATGLGGRARCFAGPTKKADSQKNRLYV